jgi:hypothetical protein
MIGATIDIGPNLVDLGKYALPIIVTAIGTLYARKSSKSATEAAVASTEAATQLTNNGGGSALDKLEAGQREIMAKLDDVEAVQISQGESISRLQQVMWRGDPPTG